MLISRAADGGTWNTIAGQPTDDSEMALLLARMLIERGDYDPDAALQTYQFWLNSDPFDCGMTISASLRSHDADQPLGYFRGQPPIGDSGWLGQIGRPLTHPNPVCLQANSLFTMAIARTIASGCEVEELYQNIKQWAADLAVDPALMDVIHGASKAPPADYIRHQGWVLIAFRNALWQLLNAPSLEAGVVDTVMRGGDTDTNAAICGALLGAVYGLEAIPGQWVERVLNCRPKAGQPGVRRPRPECFWPADALELATQLISSGTA